MQLNIHEINKLVINLPERNERLHKFIDEFGYIFPGDTFQVINGVKAEPSFHGIAEAHMNAIKHAKENNWPNVLIMEDDLYIPAKEKATKYINEAFNKVPDDWDVLLGGVYHSVSLTKENNYWNRIGEFCALHFYIVNARAYDKLLTWDKTNHYDRWIGKTGLKCFVPTRFFAIQYDGYSDNVNKITDYNSTYLSKFTILK
jgi:glycosyl transferase family 25